MAGAGIRREYGEVSELRRDPIGVTREAVSGFLDADGTGLAAEAAYRLVFALPALTIFFASLSGIAAQYTGVDVFQSLLDRARDALPQEAFQTMSLVFDTVEEQSGFGVLSIGLVIALWSGSNAMAALVKAVNRAHGLEDARGIVSQRLLALALTIGLSLLVITAIALFIFGQQIGEQLASALGYGDAFSLMLNIVRLPIILLLFLGALTVLYGFGPAERMALRHTYPGAFIATLVWIVATWLFSLYLTIADPGSAYGVLGGILVLLLFLYISSIVVIIGAEFNATLLRRRGASRIRAAREEHPVDVMSSTVGEPELPHRSPISGWVVLGILFAGAVLGSLFRRRRPPDQPTG